MEKNLNVNDLKKIYLGNENITKKNIDKFVDLMSATSFLIGIHSIIEQQTKVLNTPTYMYKLIAHTEDEIIKKMLNTDLKGEKIQKKTLITHI